MTDAEKKEFSLRISQASKTELIVIMYQMAAKYLNDADKLLHSNDIQGFRNNLMYAKRVINELNSSLDMRYPISLELARLYIFMNNTIVRADVKKDSSDIVRIITMLKSLCNSFDTISKSDNSGAMMDNTQQVYAGLTYSKSSLNENMFTDINRGYKV